MRLPGRTNVLGGVDRVTQTPDDVVHALATSDRLSTEGVGCA